MKVADPILNLVPYVPGKPIGETKREFQLERVVKLASNENPLGPSPKAVDAMTQAMKDLHRYPDPICFELKQKVANQTGFPTEMITFGNGSDELMDLLIKVYASAGGRVLSFASSFVAYKIAAQSFCVPYDEAPVGADFEMDVDSLLRHYKPSEHRLIFLVNPNNPTGRYIPKKQIETLLSKIGSSTDTLVVVDEAYVDYPRAKDYGSVLELVKTHPNLCVLRTLSKAYGLAGIRLGTLWADSKVIDYIDRVRKPFNVNHLAQVAAIAALDDHQHVESTVKLTWRELDRMISELQTLGVKCIPSEANFVLFETSFDSNLVFQGLLKHGVIVRPVRNYGLPRHIRLSIGTSEENQIALQAIKTVLKDLASSRN